MKDEKSWFFVYFEELSFSYRLLDKKMEALFSRDRKVDDYHLSVTNDDA
ncbi:MULTISPECIES: hypothetical protein [Psychrobacillus]|uniref:Uncharacterized protein n=1 Tax=Psychrobacillus faecigallinarum TaxID=2762235 RepID=A0ABR8R5C5_9BACI|nr:MULTISPECIES: hypothetical protein [Psychrobacillus]MBD7942990.1 hypothetical protein [Psychrobacillus faecigallinarum]QGM30986.1 hypothetical protein GI482_11580 [Bacillus sp. N3536]